MKRIILIAGNFLRLIFRKWWHWPVYLLLPVGCFLLMVFILDLGGLSGAVDQGLKFYLFFIFMQAGLITGLMIKDRQDGVLARIRISPVRSAEYTLGNMAAAFFVILLQIIVTLIAVSLLFPGMIAMKVPGIILIFGISGFSAVGLGVLLSLFAEDTTQGAFIYNFVLYPSSILGGCFFPLEYMSPMMQRISVIFPQTWGVKAINAVLRGDFETGLLRLGIILLTGILFLVMYAYFHQRRDVKI